MSHAAIRAERGARLMDRMKPDWFRSINAGALDIRDVRHCVLGQLYYSEADSTHYAGGYDYAACELKKKFGVSRAHKFMSRHGFMLEHADDVELELYWLEEIRVRRATFAERMEAAA